MFPLRSEAVISEPRLRLQGVRPTNPNRGLVHTSRPRNRLQGVFFFFLYIVPLNTSPPRNQGVRPLDLRDESEKLVAHHGEVSVVLYNMSFDFILSADRGGFVSTWSLATGAQIFKFVCVEVLYCRGLPVFKGRD